MAHFRCRKTGNQYDLNEAIWQSPEGGLLDIIYQPDAAAINRFLNEASDSRRFRYLTPVGHEYWLSFREGATPLVPFNWENVKLFGKLDYLLATGSFKDRGAAALISKVNELGIKKVVEDSSGNAGASIAAYCALAGIECDIYLSEHTSVSKLTQIAAYGANIKKIPGGRSEVTKAVKEAAKHDFFASHYWNPFFFEGTKTYAYEIWEQMGKAVPDVLLLQAGHGTLILGAYKGFMELKKAGFTDKLPKIVAVQAERCAPLYDAFYGKEAVDPQETIAEGINIEDPPRLEQMKTIIGETGGDVISVSDESIKRAMIKAASSGFYIEAAAASVLAAVPQYSLQSGETMIVSLTGHGLKNTDKFKSMLNI